ncbi:unnamed protein product [Urochloa decumbens]|uniref:F-box domain-containing protein n=1 Tax=Urochloa decumbens TaxID=240449 RepID=A0ABC9BUM7_9POAL
MEARRKRRPPSPDAADDAAPTNLDSLPTEMLEKIVSCLPIRDAVRTSAVSRAWRHLWESAPGLALEWDDGADPAARAADAVLARYSRAVRIFRFVYLPVPSSSRADCWVPLLAGKGVQALQLWFIKKRDVEPHYMSVSIFSCRELTHLNLAGCDIPAAPSGLAGGFPNLTSLYLHDVGFPESGVRGLEALIAESPLLEALSLNDLWIPEEEDEDDDGDQDYESEAWVIQAPNLRELTIESEYDHGWQIEELPFIEQVEIRCGISRSYSSNRDFVKLLTGLARVSKLELVMPWREDNAFEGLSCTFENLKDLSLRTDFCTLSIILSTLCLLKNAPNLEKLFFEICCCNLQEFEVGVDLLNAEWTDSLFANLRSVTMELATCQSNEMHFIQFVLSKARNLQEFHVLVCEGRSRSNEELIVEIAKYRRTSPEAKVFLRTMVF